LQNGYCGVDFCFSLHCGNTGNFLADFNNLIERKFDHHDACTLIGFMVVDTKSPNPDASPILLNNDFGSAALLLLATILVDPA
jgi:hypothetical protein